MNEQIEQKVAGIIRTILQQQNISFTTETSSKDIDGWDSLRHVMIIAEVEKEFGITIDFMEMLDIKTFGDICSVVEKYTA